MYQKMKEEELAEVLAYYRQDRKNCLYSYIDLKKYGFHNPHLQVYLDRDPEAHRIRSVIFCYYGGYSIFSYEDRLDIPETGVFLAGKEPVMVNGPETTIRLIYPYFKEKYLCETGFVTEYTGQGTGDRRADTEDETETNDEIETVRDEDFPEVAALICTDEGVGGTYTPEGLARQLLERRRDGFGRNYCIRRDGRIVCHAATYAEADDLAVISGVITAEDSRGQNLADKVVSKLNKELMAEGKLPCLFYFTQSAERLYEKTGYASGSGWAKLVRKQG